MASSKKSFCSRLQLTNRRTSKKTHYLGKQEDKVREETDTEQDADVSFETHSPPALDINESEDHKKNAVSDIISCSNTSGPITFMEQTGQNVTNNSKVTLLHSESASSPSTSIVRNEDVNNDDLSRLKQEISTKSRLEKDDNEKMQEKVMLKTGQEKKSIPENITPDISDTKEVRRHTVKFTISLESNPEEETPVVDVVVTPPQHTPEGVRESLSEIPKESSSLPSLKLNLSCTESMSSPESGNSPDVRYSQGRVRLPSGENSLTSTPTSRPRRQTVFCTSYFARKNLSRENAFEDSEDGLSVSSSDFSPGSTLSSVGADRFHGNEDFSDDACSDSKVKEGSEAVDETPPPADMRTSGEHTHLTPVNKQLRIVTSVDRALYPHRRSSLSSPKFERSASFGRSSTENLEHIAFIDYLKRNKLGQYLKNFPSNMSMFDFKATSEQELVEVYGVHDVDGRLFCLSHGLSRRHTGRG
ncbi:hypothetical protein Btru_014461 [Bulinus truncatus]|nr:hypothetical protein Btru_014461 [Bulinus truncatus]